MISTFVTDIMGVEGEGIFANLWTFAFLKTSIDIGFFFLSIFALTLLKNWVLKRPTKSKNTEFKNQITLATYKLIKSLLFVLVFYSVAEDFDFLKKYSIALMGISFVAGVLIIARAAFRATDAFLEHSFPSASRDLAPLTGRLIKIIIFMIGLMITMRHFDYDIWHIVTALGIGSLAVGLAAQPTLTNIIAGFNLLLDRPFQTGDRVKLSSGEIGDVMHIGMRSTLIKTADGNTLISPNSDLVNSKVINFSLPDNGVTSSVKFQFETNSDISKIKSVLNETLNSIEGTSKPADVFLSAVTNGYIEVTVNFAAQNYTQTAVVTDRVIDSSIRSLRSNQISFAENKLKSAFSS